jgi:predicted RNA-binding Zn ribbon-like protein
MIDVVTTSAPLLGEPWPVELMNTVWADRDGVHDALDDPRDAAAWLETAATGLDVGAPDDGTPPTEEVLVRLRALRDALRRLAAEVTGDPRTSSPSPLAAAVDDLNRVAGAAPSWSTLTRAPAGHLARVTRSAAPGPEAVVSRLAEQGVELFTDPDRPLRACLAPGCVLFFVKQHPRREWCSAGCGNRARVARHYRRRHGG